MKSIDWFLHEGDVDRGGAMHWLSTDIGVEHALILDLGPGPLRLKNSLALDCFDKIGMWLYTFLDYERELEITGKRR
jgi:hypothetical protein